MDKEEIKNQKESLVLYCLIRRKNTQGKIQFLTLKNDRGITFPPTKFRPDEDLYSAVKRVMEDDLNLPMGSYFPESELEMIPNDKKSPHYTGLSRMWYLFPVDISLNQEGWDALSTSDIISWQTLEEIKQLAEEPNIQVIIKSVKKEADKYLKSVWENPSMDAMACFWAYQHTGGVRVIRGKDIHSILQSGDRAFNLRVADPYLPYQSQGLGFTWSFFTPKDRQDLHVHGMPAVEIYGVIEGHLQVWYKPSNYRGVRTWKKTTLGPGDWLEVEPLQCHFACWTGKEGLGTVIKAAGMGELAGKGKIGIKGKTTCLDCNENGYCAIPPVMKELMEQYDLYYQDRNWEKIAKLTRMEM